MSLLLSLITALCAAVVPATAAAQTQQSAACSWTAETLPTGPDTSGGSVRASGPNGYLLGLTTKAGKQANIFWHNKVPNFLPVPTGTIVQADAINGRGEVVGFRTSSGVSAVMQAFVYRNGTYVTLPSPAGVDAWAHLINEAGDIVGTVGNSYPKQVVLWPAGAPHNPVVVAQGSPVGLDEARRVILGDGRIVSPNGSVATVAGYPTAVVHKFAGGRLVGEPYQGNPYWRREWNIAGALVRQTPGFRTVAISPSGLLVAWYYVSGFPVLGLWQNGTFVGTGPNRVEGVTDRDELFGQAYPTPGGVPALWTCVPTT